MKLAQQRGFTIVELLIVVVVIAILAAITIVAFNGIQQRATTAALQSETSQALKKLETYAITNDGAIPPDASTAGLSGDSLSYFVTPVNNTYCVQSKKNTQAYSFTNIDKLVKNVDCTERGLIGWWQFNNSANDTSGNSFNGTINGGITSTNGQNGQADQAYNFVSASTSNVQIAHNATFNDVETFSFWINPANWSTSTASTIMAKRNSAASGSYYIAYLNGSGSLVFDCGGSGTSPRWTAGYAPPLNQWTHIVFTCSTNTGVALYTNGTLAGSRSDVVRGTSTQNMRIGQDSAGVNLGWNGGIDDVRLFNRVLTTQEINNLFTTGAK